MFKSKTASGYFHTTWILIFYRKRALNNKYRIIFRYEMYNIWNYSIHLLEKIVYSLKKKNDF